MLGRSVALFVYLGGSINISIWLYMDFAIIYNSIHHRESVIARYVDGNIYIDRQPNKLNFACSTSPGPGIRAGRLIEK